MKRYLLLLVLLPSLMFGQSNMSKPKSFYIAKEVKPPVLNIDKASVHFTDPSGNNAIDANEDCMIRFQIKNSGKGDGMGCYAKLSAIGTTDGLNYRDIKLNTIPAGQTRMVEIPIKAGIGTKNGQVNFTVYIHEGQGFSTEEIQLTVNTREFESPMLKVVDYSITGSSAIAKLEKRVPFDLQVLLQNTKYGKAESVNVKIHVPDGVMLLDEGMADINFSVINGGETKSLVFPLIALVNYDSDNIPIDIQVYEKYGKYAENRTIEKHSFNTDNELIELRRYQFDEIGSLCEITSYLPNGSLKWKEKYIYDSNGRLAIVNDFGPNGELRRKETYKYNFKGDIVELIGYDSDNQPSYQLKYIYKKGYIDSICHTDSNIDLLY